MAEAYSVRGYPTVVFIDAAGREVDRIVGYAEPKEYAANLRRIAAGDTMAAAVENVRHGPVDVELVRRVSQGFIDRGDAILALETIFAFNGSAESPCCRDLVITARGDLQRALYRRTEKALLAGGEELPEVPTMASAPALALLVSDTGISRLDPEAIAARIHDARREDTGVLLAEVGSVTGEDRGAVMDLASLAFSGGQYQRGAALYAETLGDGSGIEDPDLLNRAAWNVYLARDMVDRDALERATKWAQKGYEAEMDPSIGDTLAHLLYVNGEVEKAVALQEKLIAALENTGEAGEVESLGEVLETMKAGGSFDDAPRFERYPRIPKAAKADG